MSHPLDGLPDRIRLPLAFDPAPLAADLAAFGEEEWVRHFVPSNYEGSWSVIPLRAAAGETHPVRMIGTHPLAKGFVDTAYLDRAPAMRALLARMECALRGVRLMRLTPGSRILEHDDYDPDEININVRLHVPVITNDAVAFLLNRTQVPMAPGELWYLRLSDPHSVDNDGDTDRVHLVLDVRMSDWLAGQLREGAAVSAARSG